MALVTEMDSVGLAIIRQIKHERGGQAVDMSGILTRLEDAIMRRMDKMEGDWKRWPGKAVRSRQDMMVLTLIG